MEVSAMATTTSSSSTSQLQVRLLTDQPELAVPTVALSVPATIDPDGLNSLVIKLLQESRDDDELETKRFQFIVLDALLSGRLDEFLAGQKDSISPEAVLEIKYIESVGTPTPGHSSNHDDWVSGVASRKNYVLTACYDNTVNIFNAKDGQKILTVPGHTAPVRDVAWISLDEEFGLFASCSHDQTLLLYKWNIDSNTVETMNCLKGHERSVDCLAVNNSATKLASGSFDTTLKVWGSRIACQGDSGIDEDDGSGDGETERKKGKFTADSHSVTRTPIMTLAGHKEGISGVTWLSDAEVATASWDHTIKLWDLEMGGMKTELVGNKSFFSITYSPIRQVFLTASADSAIRLYDPRSTDNVIVKCQYTSHKGWITAVRWSATDENLFVSGSHDQLVKMWDARSYRAPLFDLKGHEDRVLCCDWGEQAYVASGGADNTMKVFYNS